MSVMFYPRWDLSVYDRNGQLVLAVEVKRKTKASPEWAAQFRHNLLAHETLPTAPYLLMAFPDRFYLWTNATTEGQSIPTYTIDTASILQPYFERARVSADEISGESLELIVASWLEGILGSDCLPEPLDPAQHWLVESGLYAALAGGRFEYGAAA